MLGSPSAILDLTNAVIVLPDAASGGMLRTYGGVLAEQVRARTGLRWPIVNASMAAAAPVGIELAALSPAECDWSNPRREGFRISAATSAATTTRVLVTGADLRGTLFGVGRLLQLLNLTLTENYYTPRAGRAELDTSALGGIAGTLASWPDRPMRGIQVGYRPKTNSYDGLTAASFEAFALELALFGVNQVELIPHSFDDAPFSPHFSLPHAEMNVAMSAALAKYGLNVSLWFPACDPSADAALGGCATGDFSNATVMAAARADWAAVFSSMPRVDTLFLNAGDPGGQKPDALVAIAQAAKAVLREHHPQAQLWICPQDWLPADFARWIELAALPETAAWLDGVVYGPGMAVSLPAFKAAHGAGRYPVRLYPDITHSLSDQLPVPNWDPALALTNYREAVNARPLQHGRIAASQKPHADAGIGTYNEGHHDDVNKHVWAAVMWGCDGDGAEADCDHAALVRRWLASYCNLHFGSALAPLVLEGIYQLEQNWVGALLGGASPSRINATLATFRAVEAAMTPRDRWKWRLQQLLYRANFDAFVQVRAAAEAAGEGAALELVRAATAAQPAPSLANISAALDAAGAALDAADERAERDGAALWTELRVWAEALFQQLHQQFSVPLYGGEYTRRGNTLDTARLSLSDAPYLRNVFGKIRAMTDAGKARTALASLASWQTSAAGDFYDDLGEVGAKAAHYIVDSGVNGSQPQTGDQAVYSYPIVGCEAPIDQHYQPIADQSGSPPVLPDDKRRSQQNYIKSMCVLPPSWSPPPPAAMAAATAALVKSGKSKFPCPQTPIKLLYVGLPSGASYTLAATGLDESATFNVTANGALACSRGGKLDGGGALAYDSDDKVWSCAIPAAATAAGGDLTLAFESNCCAMELAEVWLRRVQNATHA